MLIYSLYYTHKPGGFCKRLYRLLNAISQNGHEVVYFSLDQPPQDLNARIKWQRIPFLLKTRSGLLFWLCFILWVTVYCCFTSASKNPRWLVFSPFYSALLIFCKLCNGNSLICFIRSKLSANSSMLIANLADRFITRLAFLASDRIIVQTKANHLLATALGCAESKLLILPNDLPVYDLTVEPILSSDPLKVLAAGVFNQKKNLQLLIKTWQILEKVCAEKNLKCPQLSIAGKINIFKPLNNNQLSASETEICSQSSESVYSNRGRNQNQPAEKFTDPHISHNIHFLGWCDDMQAIYRNHNLYLHPSTHEGMPNSLLEAIASGMAAIAAKTDELLEVMGDPGLCFDPEDPKVLADLILKLQLEPESLQEIRGVLAQKTQHLRFDWDGMALTMVLN